MKNLFCCIILAFWAGPVFAQFHIGLSTGTNLSFWTWEIKSLNTNIDYEAAMGWRATVLAEYKVSPAFSARIEAGTQLKANKITKNLVFESDILAGDYGGTPWVFREKYQFWEASALVQIAPIKKYRQAYLLAGCTAGKLQKGWKTAKGSEAGMKFSSKDSIDFSDPNWNRNAFAADFGVGGNFPLGANSLIKVEARFQYSLSNLSNSDNVNASVNPLILNIGYMHRL